MPEQVRARGTKLVVIFALMNRTKILLEKRVSSDQYINNQLIVPGGMVESHELGNIEQALKREMLEELGLIPTEYTPLTHQEEFLGFGDSIQLKPFLITKWVGEIPKIVLDEGNPLVWVELEDLIQNSPRPVQRIAEAVKNYLAQHDSSQT